MANIDAPKGFVPVRNPLGTTTPVMEFQVTASQTVGIGTIVYLTAAGTVQAWDGTTTGVGTLIGAALNHVKSSDTDRTVKVAYDPNQEYEVQTDDNSITAIGDLIGSNFPGVNMTSVNSTTGLSQAELDASAASASNDLTTNLNPFRGLRLVTSNDNDVSLANNRVIVKINSINHFMTADAGVA